MDFAFLFSNLSFRCAFLFLIVVSMRNITHFNLDLIGHVPLHYAQVNHSNREFGVPVVLVGHKSSLQVVYTQMTGECSFGRVLCIPYRSYRSKIREPKASNKRVWPP